MIKFYFIKGIYFTFNHNIFNFFLIYYHLFTK